MRIEAKCKFCSRPLSLSVDDEYAKLGDPYQLIKFSACNPCADFQLARRSIAESMRKRCLPLIGRKLTEEAQTKHCEAFTLLVKRFMRLYSEKLHQPMPDWDEGIVDALLATPGNYGDILARIPQMFQQPTLV